MFNRQRKLPLKTSEFKPFLFRLAELLGLQEGFSVVLVSDDAMRTLNRRFAGNDYSTDVLSFPSPQEDRGSERYLGDIFISVETAGRQASGGLLQEIRVLCVHGVLHLLGYDHEVDHGEMASKETSLRRELGLPVR